MESISSATRIKVFFIGLCPIAAVVVFLTAAQLTGFPVWQALTETIETNPEGREVVTTIMGVKVSSRPATKKDMIVHEGGSRLYAWFGVMAGVVVSGIGVVFIVAALLPADRKLLLWVVRRMNNPHLPDSTLERRT